MALITVQRGRGENRIIVVPGSNMLLSTEDVDHAAQAGFLDARVLLCQFEVGQTFLYFCEFFVLFNRNFLSATELSSP